MGLVIKRLSLGTFLIGLMSGALLVSDWHQRKVGAQRIPRVAILVYASQPVLLQGLEGTLEALKDSGFVDGQNLVLQQYNAEGDIATVNAIARQVTSGEFDVVITFSTPAMQAVAKNNESGKTVHVFGIVADPFTAGVGLRRDAPLDHPRHMVGTGLPLPVAESFRLARKFFPALKSVGVVWNPAESNSVTFVTQARAVARELEIELLEAHVDNSSGVFEAASSLVSRAAETLWIPGDNTVQTALNSILTAGKKGRIPVFSIVPADPKRGTLFDLGADFQEAGRLTGKLAVDIIRGSDPAAIPVRDFAPKRLVVNKVALKGLKDRWHIPEDVIASADIVVDETGVHVNQAAGKSAR